MGKILIIGTRGSKLALWQANWVKSSLEAKHPSLSIQLETIKTKGDKILDVPLAKVGGKGLFVKEIEEALLDGKIDLAVHSMKDMPGEIPKGLCIGAIPQREIPQDVLISRNKTHLSKLVSGAKIGTSSLRRKAQLLHARPDLVILPLRGNLDTRLKKLETENLDAIILAAAGVKRLGLENRITEYLDENIMLPAVGQGALCIEIRQHDPDVESIVATLEDPQTRAIILGERAFLNRLEGGCQVPIAAYGKIDKNIFTLSGLVATLDGKTLFKETIIGPIDSSESLGIELAERLISMGAEKIIEALKDEFNENDDG
ncbi:MAG: hydroxymethylbilane synthase [Deltaproteobacteria bacterium]|jgi:hydroxymethylbilane synthase|nr:hydroxymethylbilane synthase [Deltaproteobacteria bacterium]MBW2492685.1 hydroxymethylbilane synthase [Deltaproteobacteria bacterium]